MINMMGKSRKLIENYTLKKWTVESLLNFIILGETHCSDTYDLPNQLFYIENVVSLVWVLSSFFRFAFILQIKRGRSQTHSRGTLRDLNQRNFKNNYIIPSSPKPPTPVRFHCNGRSGVTARGARNISGTRRQQTKSKFTDYVHFLKLFIMVTNYKHIGTLVRLHFKQYSLNFGYNLCSTHVSLLFCQL